MACERAVGHHAQNNPQVYKQSPSCSITQHKKLQYDDVPTECSIKCSVASGAGQLRCGMRQSNLV